ncbi:DivIVA domain-containing protein [Lipingzhangella halophila]|uniref:DivIVA domain-containing protein n=1 Tax=Lipingzhangella halophila TaxID=1783352 RepID=A0A7W7RDA2_9ACTN|nr:DivIVA domain-containing protein [Lipingzhangella halophila]MBB4929867.1 DivIVA domain-containing protein [Lipingzhangella halophila]
MTPSILVLITVAAVAVLAGVAFVVMDRRPQLTSFQADHPPLDLPTGRPVTADDLNRVRLPLALWGYHVRAVDEALAKLAAELQERDDRIAELEGRPAEPEARASAQTVGQTTPYDRPPGNSRNEHAHDPGGITGGYPQHAHEGPVRTASPMNDHGTSPQPPQN